MLTRTGTPLKRARTQCEGSWGPEAFRACRERTLSPTPSLLGTSGELAHPYVSQSPKGRDQGSSLGICTGHEFPAVPWHTAHRPGSLEARRRGGWDTGRAGKQGLATGTREGTFTGANTSQWPSRVNRTFASLLLTLPQTIANCLLRQGRQRLGVPVGPKIPPSNRSRPQPPASLGFPGLPVPTPTPPQLGSDPRMGLGWQFWELGWGRLAEEP